MGMAYMENKTVITETIKKIKNAVLGSFTRTERVELVADGVFISPDSSEEYRDIPEFSRNE